MASISSSLALAFHTSSSPLPITRPSLLLSNLPPKLHLSNGSRLYCMQVVNPFKNKRFETLSYVPPLTADQIAKQIDYIVAKGWIPCLEFDDKGVVFRENSKSCGYYDGRYWTMWKLPMFGCQDAAAVLNEIEECKKTYPDSYIRVMAFNNKRQVQCAAFLVQTPSS